MPGVSFRFPDGMWCHLDFVDSYKPGDPAPTGYMDWHEWAEVQHKAGLRQERCGRCCKLGYPQELSAKKDISYPQRRDGTKVRMVSPVCLACAYIPDRKPAKKKR